MEALYANCDKDPIHTPGATQKFGALIAADPNTFMVTHVSDNLFDFLNIKPEVAIKSKLTQLFTVKIIHDIKNALARDTPSTQREHACFLTKNGRKLDIYVLKSIEHIIIELVPVTESSASYSEVLEKIRWLLANVTSLPSTEQTLSEAVKQLRAISRFDMVMAYRFRPDGSGEVIAESKNSFNKSYLNLRFPASDIPQQARDIFLKSPIRVIENVTNDTAGLISASKDIPPLNLTAAILRGVHPVHIQYLENMGVRSSMTLPIIIEGKLWGLFASHHYSERKISSEIISAYEIAGKLLNLVLEYAIRINKSNLEKSFVFKSDELILLKPNPLAIDNFWQVAGPTYKSIISCDGIAYIIDGKVFKTGDCPTDDLCLKLVNKIKSISKNTIFTSEKLSELLPKTNFGNTAGCLSLLLSESDPSAFVIYFRNLVNKNINWAGTPEKNIISTPEGLKLNPRDSFNNYIESIKDACDSWENNDIEVATSLLSTLKISLANLKNKKAAETSEHKKMGLITKELNHRVRNIFSLIRSISSQSKNSADSIENYAKILEERILSLAGAHDLLTEGKNDKASIIDLIKIELKPYLSDVRMKNSYSGPDLFLKPDITPTLILIFHELASNAAKYGALSTARGKIQLNWSIEDNGDLKIIWQESKGPKVITPTKKGFGRSIIEGALSYQLEGRSELSFHEDGVRAQFWITPVHFTLNNESNHTPHLALPIKKQTSHGLKCALVLEDNFIIAQEHEKILLEVGFTNVDSVGQVNKALILIENSHYDLCVLDINLKDTTSLEVAKKAIEKNLKVVYSTGLSTIKNDLNDFPVAPSITKPLTSQKLMDVLDEG